MKAYAFKAALHCASCAAEIARKIDPGLGLESINRSDDSDKFPQGPYENGGGEADSPQHCDTCGAFLQNPLTPEGREYLKEQIRNVNGSADVLFTWMTFYADEFRELLAEWQRDEHMDCAFVKAWRATLPATS